MCAFVRQLRGPYLSNARVRRLLETQNIEPGTVTIPIIVQDPFKTPNPVKVTVRRPLLAGPIGERLAVFDYNVNRDVVFPPATPRKDGSFPEYDLDDVRFHQLNAYAIAARATELVELELGRPLRWGFDGSRLLVVPHAGVLENAFYSAESHSLQFYSFVGTGRHRRVYHSLPRSIRRGTTRPS